MTGVQTTLPFDRALVRDPAFADETGATLTTDWVGARWDGAADRARAAEVAVAAAASVERASPPRARVSGASLRKDAEAGSWRDTGRRTQTDRWPR